MRSCSLLLAALLVGGTSADLQAQMSGEAQQPETDEDKFVDAARHGRFQEVRDLHAKGVEPDYYNDATVSRRGVHRSPQPVGASLGWCGVPWTLLNADVCEHMHRRVRAMLLSTGPL